MKKITALILTVIIFLMSVISAYAVTIVDFPEYPDFKFAVETDTDNNKFYSVSQYLGQNPDIIIPETVNEISIKHIYNKGFYKNSVVENITLNSKITQIVDWGIRECENLTYVYCPQTLAVVGKYALAHNPKIESILLKNTSVRNFYAGAFYNNTSLKYVSLPSTTETLEGLCLSKTAVEFVNIPDGVISIGNSVFANISTLKKVYIPSSVENMGTTVFKDSKNVTVYCEKDSTAHQYCIDNNIAFQLIEKSDYPSTFLGDVDNNKAVSIKDATRMQLELADVDNIEFIVDNCDANGDCTFNINDVTYLQKYLAKYVDLPY